MYFVSFPGNGGSAAASLDEAANVSQYWTAVNEARLAANIAKREANANADGYMLIGRDAQRLIGTLQMGGSVSFNMDGTVSYKMGDSAPGGQSQQGALLASAGGNWLALMLTDAGAKGGGLLYGSEKDAYNAMWKTSKASGKEVFGWLTNKGVLVLPNSGNDNSTGKTDAYDIYSYGGKRYLEYDDGTVLRVLGSVHTHPNGMDQSYSDLDIPFMKQYSDMPMFTLGTQEVWGSRYQQNSSG